MLSDFDYKEKRFEHDIEEYLTTKGGYEKGNSKSFDRKLALDVNTFTTFIKKSQPKQWERFEKIYGADSERQIIDRFCREVKMVGLLKVFRQGFTDRGIKFRAVFFKPETTINPLTMAQYNANILHCTRQLHYSLQNENSLFDKNFVFARTFYGNLPKIRPCIDNSVGETYNLSRLYPR